MKPNLQIIITTLRPGRKGPALAEWFRQYALKDGRFEVEMIDLADVDLPLFNEPNHPRLQQYVHDHTKRWSKVITRGDAFIFVIPEYDHLPPASFINAVTYLSNEWNYKAVSFLSYGGVSGGVRAVETARNMMVAVRMMPVLDTIPVPNYFEYMTENGEFCANALIENSAKSVLDEIFKVEQGLKIIRDKNV